MLQFARRQTPQCVPKRWKRSVSLVVSSDTTKVAHQAIQLTLAGIQSQFRSKDGIRTEFVRRDGHRTLPIPPTLDPLVQAKRSQHEEPKPLEKFEDLTLFQKELRENPYARALTTSVRQCNITGVRLPNHFLLPFKTEFRAASPTSTPTSTAPSPVPEDSDTESETLHAPGPKLVPHLVHQPKAVLGPTSYILSSSSLVQSLSKKKLWQRIVTHEVLQKWGVKEKKDWVWREDMREAVLEALRQQVMERLKWGLKNPNAGLVMRVDADRDDKNAEDQAISCVLVLKTGENGASRTARDGMDTFDLPHLLGSAKMGELLEHTPFSEPNCTVERLLLKKVYLTAPAHVALLKLGSYATGAEV